MPAHGDEESGSNLGREILGGAVEVALAVVPLLALAFVARWFNVWVHLPIPDPGPSLELSVVLGFAFLFAAVLHNFFGEETIVLVDRIMLFTLAIALVALGAALGIYVRELVLHEKISVDVMAGLALVLALIALVIWLWSRLAEVAWKVPRLRTILSVAVAVLAAAIIAFMLVQFVVDDWNKFIGPSYSAFLLTLRKTDPTPLLSTLKELASVIDSLSGLLGATLATAATAYIVTSVSPNLSRIIDYLGLSRAQITAAQKLRTPLSDLIRETKPTDAVFKRDFVITPESFERESPLESVVAGGARVKFVIPRAGGTPHAFTFDKVKTLLDRAQIEIRDSLFFVYLDDPDARSEPVCYGTGPEIWELMQKDVGNGDEDRPASGRFRGEFSGSFFGALNTGNARVIQVVVENARAFALANNPLDDLLLTSVALKDTMELKDALRVMNHHKLRRALVVSTKTPSERAILGMPALAAYLWSDQDEASVSA